MAKEIDYDSMKPEVMELENGDAENVTGDLVDEGKMVPESADVEGSECLEEEATNLDKQGEHLKEQVEDLKKNADILEDTTGETSILNGGEFLEGLARNSGAFVIGANHKFPVRSRYLSGSIGSCHDLCKYGHKRPEAEKNTTRPLLGTVRERRPLARTSSDNNVRALLHEGTKKKKDGRRSSLPDSSKGEKDSPSSLNQLKFKRVQSEIKLSSVAPPRLRNRNEAQTGKKIVAQSSSLVENMTLKVKEIKTEPKKETVSRGKEKAKEKAEEPMNGSISPLKKSSSIKARLYKNLKDTSHFKKQFVSGEDSKVEPRTDRKSTKKVSNVAPPNKASPSTLRQSLVRKNKYSKDSQTQRQNGLSSSFSPSELASLPSTNEKTSQPKEETQKKSEPINPKPVRKIKSENGSRPISPRTKSSVDSRMIPRRRGSLPEEKDASAWKVKFKRGTVVALQGSNSSPRKLKFKRGKILVDENTKDGIACELNRVDDTGNEPNDTKPEPQKVQLRHQETSGKKDNVDLNNVIEETATKLVKTRKSKVKALVGAFESVMTIHESRMEAGAS